MISATPNAPKRSRGASTLECCCEAAYTFDKGASQAYKHGSLTEMKNTFWREVFGHFISSVLT